MKDEERAEEYVDKECCQTCPNTSHTCKEKCECWEFARKAFLAGLTESRPKWHKVADGDFPKDGVQVLSEKGHLVIYKGDCFCWFEYSPNADNIKLRKWEEPIAWCEKPTYTDRD